MNKRSKTVINGLEAAGDDVLAKHTEFVNTNMIRDVVIDLMDTTKVEMDTMRNTIKKMN